MTIVKCPIWGTPAFERPSHGDGRFIDSPRAGGKYFVAGTAAAMLESCDDLVKARLTSWLIKQRQLSIEWPEIYSTTISEAQQRQALRAPECAHGILRYLKEKSKSLGTIVRYSVFIDLYDKSLLTPTEQEKEYLCLLAHSECISMDDLNVLMDYLEDKGLIKNISRDDKVKGCNLTVKGSARVDELKLDVPVEEVGCQYGKDVQPLHQLLQVPLAKLQRWFLANIRVWWKMCATAVILFAALTTGLVNSQAIKGWFTTDSRPVETTGGDRTSPVQIAPDPNKDADEHAAPERPPAGSQTQVQSKLGRPSDDPKLAELASQIRKDVESMAKPGEKWVVREGPRISVWMYNPKNPSQGRGREINASNRDDLKSVMDLLRSEWARRAREDEEYERNLFKK